jgi:hypothetical protein
MKGRVSDGAPVTLEPCDPNTLRPDGIVLVRVKGTDYLPTDASRPASAAERRTDRRTARKRRKHRLNASASSA